MAKMMIDTSVQKTVSDMDQHYEEVREELRTCMPHIMEKAWRLYGNKGVLTQDCKDSAVAARKTRFNPKYGECPWPVRIDKTKGWEPSNLKPCGYCVPADVKGKDAVPYAQVHCEEHLDYYFEVYAPRDDDGNYMVDGRGIKLPPHTTKPIKNFPPIWVDDPTEDPYAPERERMVHKLKKQKKEQAIKDREDAEATAEAINNINRPKRGRPKKEI